MTSMNKKELKNLPQIYNWGNSIMRGMMDEPINLSTVPTMVAIGLRDSFCLVDDKDGIYKEDCFAWLRDAELFLIASDLKELSKPCTLGILHRRITNYLWEKIDEYRTENGKTSAFPFDPYDDNISYRVGRWMENYFKFICVLGKYYYREEKNIKRQES
jgi:hypothetical protein